MRTTVTLDIPREAPVTAYIAAAEMLARVASDAVTAHGGIESTRLLVLSREIRRAVIAANEVR